HETIIGLLSVASAQHYTQREINVVAAFAQQAALAVENTRILSELETSLTNLREAQSQLVRTARLSAAGEIAAGVAHQINNPLTTVIAESHLMLQDIEADDPNRESLEAVLEAAQRAGTVVRRMLDLTRTHAYTMQPVDINTSLENSLALIRAQIVPHVARLEVDLAEHLPPVKASDQHLEDVWINLLINARDALRGRKDGMIRVSSRLSEDKQTICVTVEDNGAGMSAEQASRIFEPFFTTKEYGTGLGLSICQDVITHHGGTIRVESTEGWGTTFMVILPVNREGVV
ncbi:MAG TPA: ATP-binding protein, partial [Aggregatilineaceae bacterium]|nr:ATP-binding protein [Aggregatilineaceae bacterium]